MEETLTMPQRLQPRPDEMFDLIIIGAGPAGMSAGICAVRGNLKTLIIEKALPGGECTTACKVQNFLGFPGGIYGEALSKRMEDHLFDFKIHYTCENVTDILNIKEKVKEIKTGLGNTYKTKTIILAMGLEPKKLDVGFEFKFLGRGISYYAQCDVNYYKGENVVVIGGGNCACYAADYLSKFVNKVYMIHHFDHLRAVATLKQSISQNPKIDIMWNSQITEVFGIEKVEKVKVSNVTNDQHTWLDVKGVFVYVGRIPPKEIVSLDVDVDENGYLITDEYMKTNIPGVYAAGDLRSKQIRQIATAVSDGMIAAINVGKDYF